MILRIGIDVGFLGHMRGTGIPNYAKNLLKNICKIDNKNEYIIFTAKNALNYIRNDWGFDGKIVTSKFDINNSTERILWQQIYLNKLLKNYNIDLVHCMDYMMPVLTKIKTIITVHDLAFHYYPEGFTKKMLLNKKIMTSICVKKSDSIITVSNSTKKDIIETYKIHEDKITVTPLGIDEKHFRIIEDIDKKNNILKKYSLPEKFILYVGTLEGRKNIPNLIRAYINIKNKNSHKLVIAGKKGWLYNEIFELVKNNNLENEVLFTGFVDDADLPVLYNLATVMVYPSYYEGFGLPPLEAMACGCPVITSNVSSLPEVVGDAGIVCSPNDIERLRKEMEKLINNDKIRKDISEKCFLQSKNFRWIQTAKKTIEVYQKYEGSVL